MCRGRGTGYKWGSWTSGGLWVSVQFTDLVANRRVTNLKCKMSYSLPRYPIVCIKLTLLARSVSNTILRRVLLIQSSHNPMSWIRVVLLVLWGETKTQGVLRCLFKVPS